MPHVEQFFAGHGGLQLYEQRWLPERPPMAAVAVQHGLGEHSGRYAALAAALNEHGYAVGAMDLRGHGRSAGDRVWVRRFDDYLADLDVFLDRAQTLAPGKPLFLFGHSMGAMIAACHAVARQPPLRGLVLSGPAVVVGARVFPLLRRLAKVLSALLPRLRLVRLGCRFISRDPRVVAAFENDPLCFHGRLPVRTAAEILGASERLRAKAGDLCVPLLVLHGTGDIVADAEGARLLHQTAGSSDKTLHLYDGLYHEVLSEPERERVLHDTLDWLSARR